MPQTTANIENEPAKLTDRGIAVLVLFILALFAAYQHYDAIAIVIAIFTGALRIANAIEHLASAKGRT